eukprot:CAMPEP_0170460592 /NCGR_PEP_ID=MMETSP0123-20130129/6876_1 /TAXON_ID=182087 /ORGANISM="Favella ehrenbergii, Strain Fehren 1" /LENGTH=153 /DNA_ID=CAMNT_0010725523 /DNA_START=2202 /DNA_END=2663 /DNA_ORIENTATION=+
MTMADFQAAGAGNFYYLMNFNDFPSALIVLFQQMIVNNWYVVVGFYVDKTGNSMATRLFFISFWIIVVLILMNLIIAMVLQIHDGLQEANDEKFRQIDIRIKLYNELKDSNQEQLKQKLRLAMRTIVELERQLELEEKDEKNAILLPSQQIEK